VSDVSLSQTGLLVGLVLGIVAVFGGFGAFLIVLVLGAIGLVIGRVLDGKLDLRAVVGTRTDRR
jgi:nitrate/nitrite transporter NarK